MPSTTAATEPGTMLRVFVLEETGQDAIEYALLAAIIGVAAILIWQQIAQEVGLAYVQADSDTQDLYCMPNPDGTGCP